MRLCDLPRCEEHAGEAAQAERYLARDLKTTLLNTSGINAAKAERLFATVEQTYMSPRSKAPRLAL